MVLNTVVFAYAAIYAQDPDRFSQIQSNRDGGKEIVMVLKLKGINRDFRTIAFYDSDNIDIEFDIDRYEKKPRVAASMRNIHEGMRYKVRFTVNGKAPNGLIEGTLVEFSPLFLENLP
jgi:hypothetical protein